MAVGDAQAEKMGVILRLDPLGGLSGDMILATLVELGADLREIEASLKALDLGQDFRFELEHSAPRGFAGLRLKVMLQHEGSWKEPETPELHAHHHHHHHHHHHQHAHAPHGDDEPKEHHRPPFDSPDGGQPHHRTFSDICSILEASDLPLRVQARAISVFEVLAVAEGRVHGKAAEEVHFHEVGAVDSIVDIVGSCLALEQLEVKRLFSTSVGVARGQVHCAHGRLPLPAPATQLLLEGVPLVHHDDEKELCTPTGAAFLKALAEFSCVPGVTRAKGTGVGLSHRIPVHAPPFLRGTLFEDEGEKKGPQLERLVRLSCDIDDMDGEYLSLLSDDLLKAGALDVSRLPLAMKKGRQGVELRVLCRPQNEAELLGVILSQSTSFGCRREDIERWALPRRMVEVQTPWGDVRVKVCDQPPKRHVEFDDVQRIAMEQGVHWREIVDWVRSVKEI